MPFVRGDRKPCSYSGCDGTMQFSHYSRGGQLEVARLGEARSNVLPIGETPGWVCDTDARHFEAAAAGTVWRV
jgi:hypothetical protein